MGSVHATFSIIIPTYNRRNQIIETLEKLSQQKYDKDGFEVIVIDDGSNDGTTDAVSLFKKKSNIDINLISQMNKGPAHARNAGIEISKHEYIVFLDSDCYPLANDWLLNINNKVNDIRSKEFDDFLLGGRIIMPTDTLSQKFIYILDGYGTPDLGPVGFEKQGDFISFPTTNLVVPKNTFRSVGGFDENIIFGSGEDTDFCYRLWKSGRAVFVYEPSISIFHLHRTGIFDLAKVSFKRSINTHTLLEKYGIFSKHWFRRRLVKVVASYLGLFAFLISVSFNVLLTTGILFGVYATLFLVFLLKSKNVHNSMAFPIYYIFISMFEVAGSTIAILVYLKNSSKSSCKK